MFLCPQSCVAVLCVNLFGIRSPHAHAAARNYTHVYTLASTTVQCALSSQTVHCEVARCTAALTASALVCTAMVANCTLSSVLSLSTFFIYFCTFSSSAIFIL